MTPKQILDSFSETLMRDERILSAPERALLATLLQHAKSAAGAKPDTQEAVRAVIASAVGETVAQRAFAVLGGSIVERILESSTLPQSDSAGARTADSYAGPHPPMAPQPPNEPLRTTAGPHPPMGPQPPSDLAWNAAGSQSATLPLRMRREPEPPTGQPQPPGPGVRAPHKAPQPPGAPMGEPEPPTGQPQPPGPGVRAPRTEPEPPTGKRTTVVSESMTAVAERPPVLPAQCVVLDEFLAPQELMELTRFTLEHESDFSASEVVSPNVDSGVINYEHRRSRVLMDLVQYQDLMLERIKAVLPQVLDQLGMEEFSIAGVEAQITASNDGDFFHFHSDNGSERVASRNLTFVYFFHREPRPFEGGELRIHDARLEEGTYVSEGSYQAIVPQQNQIVFFPCELMHEITPVNCASQLFADSRFTLNGWLRR
jgi:Rps23 Pro-64 3,4-dihydroxylase Tpa1-like proline 4-hydroxylase